MPSDQLGRLNNALAGHYRVEREIAQGGMATVYLAADLRHHREVALKVLRPELAAALGSDRFAREIAVAAQLNHPNILSLYDSGEGDGLLYYVMPYVRDASLRQRLVREGPLALDAALALIRQVASALDYAHARNLIHRDIKPENILLHEGVALVADFGIALAAGGAPGDRLTTHGLAIGTPEYMSPEQASASRDLDARSDLYSLASVLYELLAGEPPFTGPNAQAVLAKRFVDDPPSVRRLRPTVPPAVEQALLKALARDPADRFASCGDFVAAFTRPPAAQMAATPSVAVLPFLNISPDPENEFFTDGVTEDVIAQLSKIRSLKVISRGSVMPFRSRDRGLREIGATLGVATLLDGSVRRAGNRVRIVAQLVDAKTDRHLWGETYDRQLTDIFAIQTDVALQIAAALEAELLPQERARIRREPTSNLHAYQLYLQGRFSYSRYAGDSITKGIAFFRQATDADPRFALAHTGLALAYAEIAAGQGGTTILPDVAYHEAKESVTRALALDNELGEAHAVLGLLKFVHDFDWVGAEAEFIRALELSPGSADVYDHYGWLCGALERYEEALVLVAKAQELDPLMHRADLATTLIRAGRYGEALAEAKRVIAIEPDYPRARSTLGWAHLMVGEVEAGISNLEHAVRTDRGNSLYLAQLGEAYGMFGQPEKAREVLRELEAMSAERYISPYQMAYVYTGLGEADRAMDCLERAFQERAGSVFGIKGSFLFITLRSHPRFQALLARMNLA